MGCMSSKRVIYVTPRPTQNKLYNVTEFRPLDHEEFRKQAHQMVDFIANYYKNIESYPVLSQVQPGYLQTCLPKTAPYQPEPFETIIEDVQKSIIPGMTHWLSPNFFAFFPATVSSAAFLGDMLCTRFNSVGFNWLASTAATELEMVVIDWLANMLKLPKSFMFSGTGGGIIQGTTSESILCTHIAARDRALEVVGVHNIGKLVVFGSDQTHSTYTKACFSLSPVVLRNIRLLTTSADTCFSLSPVVLRRVIEADVADGLVPLYLCVTVGTTSTTAVDPLDGLADVAVDYGVWLHVDVAYGGSACICPEFRHYLNGIERADSLSLSPRLSKAALSTNPEYLKNKPSESNSLVDYEDWQVGTGHRFKSLRLWLVLHSYGIANLQRHIRSDVRIAKMFEGFVKSDQRLVCFRLNRTQDPTRVTRIC
ncbi:hypothetical protein ACSBR2_027565 [Camellia fascicularis]